jgi:hypothetical protein
MFPIRALSALLFLPLVTACLDVDSVEPPRQSIWEVEGIEPFDLDDPEGAYFVGAAGIVSGTGQTQFGMLLEQAEPFREFGWSIRIGDCQSAGAPITTFDFSFPILRTDDQGEAQREVLLVGNLETHRAYSAQIYLDSAEGELVACGDFSLRQ